VKAAKEAIHDTAQRGLAGDDQLAGSVLVKWVMVLEAAMPDGSHSVVRITADADGKDLFKWETLGLLQTALSDVS
jgi:hypothetical protein